MREHTKAMLFFAAISAFSALWGWKFGTYFAGLCLTLMLAQRAWWFVRPRLAALIARNG